MDDRRVISAIVHVPKVGRRWCDCAADLGPATTHYNRFGRWSRRGFWLKLLTALVDAGVMTKSTAIDTLRRKKAADLPISGKYPAWSSLKQGFVKRI